MKMMLLSPEGKSEQEGSRDSSLLVRRMVDCRGRKNQDHILKFKNLF